MSIIQPDELRDLAAYRGDPAISLFMPVNPAHDEVKQDFTRYRNLLKEAMDRIEGDAAESMIDRAESMLNDASFWRQPGRGLAVLASPHGMVVRRTGVPLAAQVEVDDHFVVKPLIPATEEQAFTLITLSQQQAQVFQGTVESLTEMNIPDLPRSGVDDVPGSVSGHNAIQAHSTGSPRQATRSSFHGHLDRAETVPEPIVRLCRSVDQTAADHAKTVGGPCFVFAVERLAATLLQHRRALPDPLHVIHGNPEGLTAAQLHEAVFPRVAEYFLQERTARRARFEERIGTGKGSDRLMDVLLAAYDGRVDQLLINAAQETFGRFDPDVRQVELHLGERRPDDVDLIDLAVRIVLLRGGEVFTDPDVDGAMATYRH